MSMYLTPDANRYQARALLKMSTRAVVSHVFEIATQTDLTARNLLQPGAATEVDLLEDTARDARALKGLGR